MSAYEVVVVGSGAAGMLAAIRAKDLGLSVAVMEKEQFYGGTSAVSGGGIWIPAHDAIADRDTPEAAFRYLSAASCGAAQPALLRAYVDQARHMTRYLDTIGVRYCTFPAYPDYLEQLPGAGRGRSMLPRDMDGALLGNEFARLRDAHPAWVAFGRYALNFELARTLNKRAPGWRRASLQMLWRYWSDISWRFKTRRDRRLSWGRALVGGLRTAMLDRNIPLLLGMQMCGLTQVGRRVVGVEFQHRGGKVAIRADAAVVLAAGGFEQNQSMRDRWLPIPTPTAYSATPAGANQGDAIRFGVSAGAAVSNLSQAWWTPVVRLPPYENTNRQVAYPLGNYRGRAHSLMVNRLGVRFANESASYDELAQEMIRDQVATGANAPCWLIFDATFRRRTAVGGVLPAWIMSDSRVPAFWWNSVLFRADTLGLLAHEIGLEAAVLESTVAQFNQFARRGTDDQFHRGVSYFDRYNGDGAHAPNPCLGEVLRAPFYAVRVDLGDLGTKGGLLVDEHAAVIDEAGVRIPGLYAVGNAACSPFPGKYPGGGATLGPAMTSAYLAAADIAGGRSVRASA